MGQGQIDFFDLTERNLIQWGIWARRLGLNLSYKSIFASYIKEAAPETIAEALPDISDETALSIESCIIALKSVNEKAFDFVLMYYYSSNNLQRTADILGVSFSQVRDLRTTAVNFIMGCLYVALDV